MLIYRGWEQYYPESEYSFSFYRDENGNDWYELRDELMKLSNVCGFLVAYRGDGDPNNNYIASASSEIDRLSPVNHDLYIVDISIIPDDFLENPWNYMLYNDTIVPNAIMRQQEIDMAVRWADEEIKMLTTPRLLQAYLAEVRAYRAELLAIDLNETPFIDLPFRP
ncbi:TPA: hypothetical protein OGU99_000355 [Escherichia coli]|nr:putative tail fiber chaperone [Escherichia phage A4]HCQ0858429.1 hypothetical protein [Escherichia coli]